MSATVSPRLYNYFSFFFSTSSFFFFFFFFIRHPPSSTHGTQANCTTCCELSQIWKCMSEIWDVRRTASACVGPYNHLSDRVIMIFHLWSKISFARYNCHKLWDQDTVSPNVNLLWLLVLELHSRRWQTDWQTDRGTGGLLSVFGANNYDRPTSDMSFSSLLAQLTELFIIL